MSHPHWKRCGIICFHLSLGVSDRQTCKFYVTIGFTFIQTVKAEL